MHLLQVVADGKMGRFPGMSCGAKLVRGVPCARGAISVVINIAARHGRLSEATQAKISTKLEKMSRLFERLTSIEVTVDLAHPENPEIDLRVSAEHKHDFVATEQGGDLMASLDGAIHKIEQQLRRYKQKVQEHRGPGLRQQPVPEDGTPE
ncbi:MAG TPA: ribosome-associated translation inhibitor RaiA [Pirellulales bacterium]|nr:ribosome-associated translation inhibitor RaiA [Pirellulales bacterium]